MDEIPKYGLYIIVIAFMMLIVLPFGINFGFLLHSEEVCEARGLSAIDKDIINANVMCSDGSIIKMKSCWKPKTCTEKDEDGLCIKIERVWRCG